MQRMKSFFVVAVTIVAFLVASAVTKALMQEFFKEDPTEALITANKKVANDFNAKAPQRLDAFTTMTQVTADGVKLTYEYAIDGSVSDYGATAAADLQTHVTTVFCGTTEMRDGVAMGGVYEYHYVDSQGIEIARFTFDRHTCP